MYLVDTNIILELLLNQDKADEAELFLRNTSPAQLYLSEFTLYSLGIILFRYKKQLVFLQTVQDLLLSGSVQIVRLEANDMQNVIDASQQFNLDFDDAYQYAAAQKYNLIIVSFDSDFDRTVRGRRTPGDI